MLSCDRWLQRGSLTKWNLTWKCGWSKRVSLNSSIQNLWHPLTFVYACWMFLEIKHCEHSEVVGAAFQQWWQWHKRQATFWTAMHSCHTAKWRASQSAHPHGSVDYDRGTVHGAEYHLQYIANDGGNIGISQMNAHKGTEWTPYVQAYKDQLNQYKAEGYSGLGHIITGDEMWSPLWGWTKMPVHGVTTCGFPIEK